MKDSFFGKCEVLGSYGDVVEVKVFGYKDIESLPDMCERIGSALPYLARGTSVKRSPTPTHTLKYLARGTYKHIRRQFEDPLHNDGVQAHGASGADAEWTGWRNLHQVCRESHLPENRLTTEELIELRKVLKP